MSVNKVKICRFELLMDAGFGAQSAGDILIRAFAKMGKYVYIEPMIPAEISPPPRSRPALSGVIIRIAEFDVTNIGNDTDVILASHEIVLDRRLDDDETNPNGKVILDMGDKKGNEESYEKVCKRATLLGLSIFPFEVDPEAAQVIKSMGGKGKNMYYIGMLSYLYNMPEEFLVEEIKRTFSKKLSEDILNKNILIFQSGYRNAKDIIPFSYEISGKPVQGERLLIDGNSALSMGIIDAGIKFFSGYPITPASSIMHTLAKVFPSYGGIVHQAEDEIAAIGAAIGAYFGGVPSVTATSGPGLSLKQEFIGYASVAEIPIIIIDVQRSGPSTGMPTKTEQSDLLSVIFGNHGDNAKIVIGVSNVRDCFRSPALARYLAEKLRMPVFILSDFATANSYKIIDNFITNQVDDIDKVPDYVFNRFFINRLPEHIEMVRTRQDLPGTPNGMRRVTGLNTDANGSVSYFSGANQRSHAIRNEKMHVVKRALKRPEIFGPEEGEILIVGWGSTRGVIEEAINRCQEQGIPVSGMHIKIVYPLPLMLKEVYSKYKKVFTVELAYGDALKPPPFCALLRMETMMDIHPMICQATGRPIRPKIIVERIKEELQKLHLTEVS